MTDYMTATAAAEHCSEVCGTRILPREVSDLIYRRKLSPEVCPVVGRVRLIPRSYLPEVVRVVRENREGRRRPREGAAAAAHAG